MVKRVTPAQKICGIKQLLRSNVLDGFPSGVWNAIRAWSRMFALVNGLGNMFSMTRPICHRQVDRFWEHRTTTT